MSTRETRRSEWTLNTVVDGVEGAPVLVLAHSLGSGPVMWDGVVERLRDEFTIVRYCLPGHGGAPIAPLERPARMSDILAALARTLDALGLDRPHLAGLSFGGLTALAAGIDMPDRFASLTVMSSGPFNGDPSQWRAKARAVREEGTASLVDATFERWFSSTAGATHGPEMAAIRDVFVGCDDEGYAQVCEVLGATDLRSRLGEITLPTLIVSAEDDASLPWEAADDLALAISGHAPVEVLKLAGVRHMSAVERPEEVADALRRHVLAADA